MTDTGWRPLQTPKAPKVESFVTTPFARLARTHALSTAGDALVTAALSGLLFFNIPEGEARGQVLAYLLLTMAPFAVVSPFIGPAIDRVRSGRRWMIIGTIFARALLCFLMIRDVDGLLLFPEAFAVLVLQKSYQVARSAIVPATVRTDEELVEANSKLSVISGVMAFAAAGPGLAINALFDEPRIVLVLGVIVFSLGGLAGLKLPRAPVAPRPAGEAERAELRSAGVLLAASAMGLLRGIVGFLTFLLAFHLRREGIPTWQFVVAAAAAGLGAVFGSLIAPRIRRVAVEERMLIGALLCTFLAGAAAMVLGGIQGATLMAAVVGVTAAAGKQAFDSIVQRDAPDANRGRSFAKFETRFQIIWVIGALIPVGISMPAEVGYGLVVAVAAFAAFSYAVGQLAARHRSGVTPTSATARAVQIEDRMNAVSGEVSGRLNAATRSLRGRIVPRSRTDRRAKPSRSAKPAKSSRDDTWRRF